MLGLGLGPGLNTKFFGLGLEGFGLVLGLVFSGLGLVPCYPATEVVSDHHTFCHMQYAHVCQICFVDCNRVALLLTLGENSSV